MPMIGEGLKVVPFQEETMNGHYRGWFSDREVVEFTSHNSFPEMSSDFVCFKNKALAKEIIVWHILGYVAESPISWVHIGNVSLQSIDLINRSAELAIIIGEKDWWGRKVGTFACAYALNHGFLNMGLYRIWAGTPQENKGMIKVLTNIGMRKEGVAKHGIFINGKFQDVLCFYCLAGEPMEEPRKSVYEACKGKRCERELA